MAAYYNEFDPFAAAWLRELMKADLIAPGEVDERSIEDVAPEDTKGFIQCHFFAGIGVWSLALRLAGWEDNRAIWTGSFPCQPFSAAGKGAGFDDPRHLWPAGRWIIENAKPRAVPFVGEQVASADGLHWFDLVSADMERAGNAVGAIDTCAAGFSAPHIRQRLYWIAAEGVTQPAGGGKGDAFGARLEGHAGNGCRCGGRPDPSGSASAPSCTCWLADALPTGRTERGAEPRARPASGMRPARRLAAAERSRQRGRGLCGSGEGDQAPVERSSNKSLGDSVACDLPGDPACGVGQPASGIAGDGKLQSGRKHGQLPQNVGDSGDGGVSLHPLNYWRDAEWLLCRDPDGARFRPVEPGSFPLVDAGALRNRLATVRGAGNALNLAQAQGFIEAVMECMP